MPGLGFESSPRLRAAKKSLCAGVRLMATRTLRYTLVLAFDNQPECYLWRLTNGKVPKTFHECPHNTRRWLLELIPIEVKEEK